MRRDVLIIVGVLGVPVVALVAAVALASGLPLAFIAGGWVLPVAFGR